MQIISFDGSCRRNGKPNCVSMGAAVIHNADIFQYVGSAERNSTNQRGELNGCIEALKLLLQNPFTTNIITDSQYIYNAITKEWFINWERKGWITASNELVKNRDKWEEISRLIYKIEEADISWSIFHIKGHMLSIGPKTASKLLGSGIAELYKAVSTAYVKPENIIKAKRVFVETHDIDITDFSLRHFIDYNTIADYVAVELLKGVTDGLYS